MWLPYHGKLHCSVKHQRPITSNIYYLNANNPSGSIKNRTPWGVPSSSESGVRRGGPISCCSSSGSSSFSSSSSPASSSSSDFCEGLIQTQRPYNQEGRIMNTCNKQWRHASQLKQLVHTQAQVGEKEKKKYSITGMLLTESCTHPLGRVLSLSLIHSLSLFINYLYVYSEQKTGI